jgi:hypothetical protein
MNIEQYKMFRILIRNNLLAIDIPGRIVLDLNPPDSLGKLYPKLTRELSLKPLDVTDGRAGNILMHQYFRLKKMSSQDTALQETAKEFRKLSGNYQFSPARLSLDVMFSDGILTTQDPTGRSKEILKYSKTGDTWIDNSGKYEIGFITNVDNEVTGLSLTVGTEFTRGEPVTNAIDQVIEDSGVEAGLKRYDEIRNSGDKDYLFSEQMLHQLGQTVKREQN